MTKMSYQQVEWYSNWMLANRKPYSDKIYIVVWYTTESVCEGNSPVNPSTIIDFLFPPINSSCKFNCSYIPQSEPKNISMIQHIKSANRISWFGQEIALNADKIESYKICNQYYSFYAKLFHVNFPPTPSRSRRDNLAGNRYEYLSGLMNLLQFRQLEFISSIS